MRPLNVLISAYACEPGKGSEPSVGWNVARTMAQRHHVTAITRANNRAVIEEELAQRPVPNLRFVYYDLPRWARWWKRGRRGIQLYYYLWQIGVYFVARRLLKEQPIDLIHHVTFVQYWKPSFLALLPRPFLWGPVGGGETAPKIFRKSLGLRGKFYEALRDAARWVGEHDPFVRLTARQSACALATTEETATRLRSLNAGEVDILSQIGLNRSEIAALEDASFSQDSPFRFVSIGRLLDLKGFHLGLRAFAESAVADAEYWIIGDGPQRARLQHLAAELGIADRVTFWGELPRDEAFGKLRQSHVLVHPSLHDSGGLVCLEAMAAGNPVICLRLGGPALQVSSETGVLVPATQPDQVVREMARAMSTMAGDRQALSEAGRQARARVKERSSWSLKGAQLNDLYARLATNGSLNLG